jgi:predicted alpha-1,6-mannanase (GH76 family)
MRNVARQSRSVAQQLSKASYRQFVLRYANVVELQADGLERLALENTKPASLQESDRLRDAELEGEVASEVVAVDERAGQRSAHPARHRRAGAAENRTATGESRHRSV